MSNANCTCGCTEDHVIARRTTADGIAVHVWSDGVITGRLGAKLNGISARRPRTEASIRTSKAAASLFSEFACLYDYEEIGALHAACRWAAERGLGASSVSERLNAEALPRLSWLVQDTDNRGTTTLRTCRLPRMQWPGLAIWHERGVYALMTVDRDDVCMPTGFRFTSLCALFVHLRGNKVAA